MAHSALVSGRFRKRSITSSSSSNIIGHEPFKKSIQPSLRNTAHISTRNTSGISCARSYRTLRDDSFEGRFPRHFVPGYDRCCPYGTRLQTFRNSISPGTGVWSSMRKWVKSRFIQLPGIQRVVAQVPGEHPTWLAPSVEGKELFIGAASVVQWRLAEPPAEAKTDRSVVL